MNQPKITIGITCYNAEDTIVRAIASAQTQDWDNFEILIADDGSTDSSRALIEPLIASDPRMKLIVHDTNKGYAGALNTILQNASGEFVAFFDDDDVSATDRLSQQWLRLKSYSDAHPEAHKIFCYSNRAVVRAGHKEPTPEAAALAIGRRAPEPHGQEVADFILLNVGRSDAVWGMFGSCTLMVATAALRDLGGFDESFRRCSEWDIAIRAAFSGAHFIAVDQNLVTQYKTLTLDKSGNKPFIYRRQLCEKHKSYLQGKGGYWGGVAMAHSQFHGGKNRPFKQVFFTILAFLLSPTAILWPKLKKLVHQMNSGFRIFNVRLDVRDSLLEFFERYLAKNMVVYDIGCGDKPFNRYMTTKVQKYIGVDVDDGFYGTGKVDLIGSAYHVPVPDGSADAVLSSQVFEHLDDPVKALQEMKRILRPEGVFFLSVPFLYPLHAEPRDYLRYTIHYLKKILQDNGFEVIDKKDLSGFWYCIALNTEIYLSNFDRGILKRLWLVRGLIALIKLPLFGLHLLEKAVLRLAGKDIHDFRRMWIINYTIVARKISS